MNFKELVAALWQQHSNTVSWRFYCRICLWGISKCIYWIVLHSLLHCLGAAITKCITTWRKNCNKPCFSILGNRIAFHKLLFFLVKKNLLRIWVWLAGGLPWLFSAFAEERAGEVGQVTKYMFAHPMDVF